jgi:hypothetical protein
MLMIKDFNAHGTDERVVLLTADQQSFVSVRDHEFRFWNTTLIVRQEQLDLADLACDLALANAELDKAVADHADDAVIGALYLKRNKLEQERKLQQEQEQAQQGQAKRVRVWEVALDAGKTYMFFNVRFTYIRHTQSREMVMYTNQPAQAEVHADIDAKEADDQNWLPFESKLLTARQNTDLWNHTRFWASNVVLDPQFVPTKLDAASFWLVVQTADKTQTVVLQVHLSTLVGKVTLSLIDLRLSPTTCKSVGPAGNQSVNDVVDFCNLLFGGLTWEQVRAGEAARQFGLQGELAVEVFTAKSLACTNIPLY